MSKRMRGIAVSRPILIGSTATPLTPAEKLTAPPDHTHRWTVAVRSAATNPIPALPNGDSQDHTTEDGGIGTRLRDSETDLHRAVGGKDDLSYFIKRVQFRLHETYAQPTRNIDHPPFSVTETGWGEFEIQIKIFFVPEAGEKPLTVLHHLKLHPWQPLAPAPAPAPAIAPAPPTDSNATADTVPIKEEAPAAASVPAEPTPSTIPPVVHSWQYEEIVFPEPLEPFYEILLAHPPTPWAATSAQAWAEPAADASQKHHIHTPTGQLMDAFSLEAQRAEADRIDLARANAVKQLDEDRSKLIHTEKLLREARAQLARLESNGP